MIFQSVPAKFEAICAEGVCENQLRSCFDVCAVNIRSGRGIGKIELIEALVKANTVGVQHGPHRAVCEDGFG
jgi:hypothetical protein